MPSLHVLEQAGPRSIPFEPGTTIREILGATNLRVRSGCRGSGNCGFCIIQIKKGFTPEPTRAERFHLGEVELRQGMRLACQVTPHDDVWIHITNPAPESTWRSLAAGEYFLPSAPDDHFTPVSQVKRPALGIAVDLGTTNVSATLWDLAAGKRLTGRIGPNQQALYGADVMTRLVAAAESSQNARNISSLAVDTIGQAIYDICSREAYDPWHITRLAIVGNTAELALLAEKNYQLLLQPKSWAGKVDCCPDNTLAWCTAWNIDPRAAVEVVMPLAGFVGSDLLASALATGLTQTHQVSLLIDFGTNAEIALWDGAHLWVTSAASGSAFEGSGLSCGVPAGPGAIYEAEAQGTPPAWTFRTLPGSPPKGLCGSGLVDVIAALLQAGMLDKKGRFTGTLGKAFMLPLEPGGIILTLRDIDLFQRAKAAIATGICYVMQAAGLAKRDLRRVYVCGSFGWHLNIPNVVRLGLLPSVESNLIELCGNTALAGCETLLVWPERHGDMEIVRRQARLVNMSNDPDFEQVFLENLYLQPMEMD